jgi:hypothetical protein
MADLMVDEGGGSGGLGGDSVSDSIRLLLNKAGFGSWIPTHFAKNAKWMGHGANLALNE